MRYSRVLRGALAALALGGVAVAQMPSMGGPPAGETPAPAPTPAGGLITSTNLTQLKAVFDAAKVPVEQKAFNDGTPYLTAMIRQNRIWVVPVDCKGDPVAGACSTVSLTSGTSVNPVPESVITNFNNTYRLGRLIANSETDRHVTLMMNYALTGGVGPDFIKQEFTFFANDTEAFIDALSKASAAAQPGAPAAPSGGFSKPRDVGKMLGETTPSILSAMPKAH